MTNEIQIRFIIFINPKGENVLFYYIEVFLSNP